MEETWRLRSGTYAPPATKMSDVGNYSERGRRNWTESSVGPRPREISMSESTIRQLESDLLVAKEKGWEEFMEEQGAHWEVKSQQDCDHKWAQSGSDTTSARQGLPRLRGSQVYLDKAQGMGNDYKKRATNRGHFFWPERPACLQGYERAQ